ncbi:hypothetical protein INR49_007637 [Caranx melampygus]|nr:hypothetical protein INR49_007637 [Caranx melampygus]
MGKYREDKFSITIIIIIIIIMSSSRLTSEGCLTTAQTNEAVHSGLYWIVSMMSLEKHVGDNDGARERGGGGRKEKKKKVPQGFWGPAKQLNGCKQHHSPHIQIDLIVSLRLPLCFGAELKERDR